MSLFCAVSLRSGFSGMDVPDGMMTVHLVQLVVYAMEELMARIF